MPELPSQVQAFIARDLNYLIGGGCVISSFLYAFDRADRLLSTNPATVLGAGLAYMVGYALQDGFSVLGLVTTHFVRNPGSFIQWLYKRFTGETWKDLEGTHWHNADPALKALFEGEYERATYERIISLKMVGTTMGPCCLLSFALLLARFIFHSSRQAFDLMLALAALIFGITFVAMAWIKAAQQTQKVAAAIRDHETKIGTKSASRAGAASGSA